MTGTVIRPALRWWGLSPGGWTRWFHESVELTDGGMVWRRGVLSRKETAVQWQNVTNVDKGQGCIDQLFGLASFRIDTAGGPVKEIVLEKYPAKPLGDLLAARVQERQLQT